MALTFRGGMFTEEIGSAQASALQEMPAPNFLSVPLPEEDAEILVRPGDAVQKGQKLAQSKKGDRSPAHSPVSGTILGVEMALTAEGQASSIRIENDFKETLSPSVLPFHTPIHECEPAALVSHLQEKGIALPAPDGRSVAWAIGTLCGETRRLVIDCTETEPGKSASYRLCLEKAEEIVGGAKILMRASGAEKAVFVIEDTREDAADALLTLVRQSEHFAVAQVRAKYPQSHERLLVRVLTKKEIPHGKSARDLGLLIVRPETAFFTYRAFVIGMPVISSVVTIGGECIKTPSNCFLPIGTEIGQVLERCGGFEKVPHKLLSGGLMQGKALYSDETVVTKTTEAILAIQEETRESGGCIHCGRCLRACPMHLMPLEFHRLVREEKSQECRHYHIDTCIECGCCSYVCPAGISLLQSIRQGKLTLGMEV